MKDAPRLGGRLEAVLGEIKGESMADIGTDHGKVAVSAILHEKAKRVIAADISESSLKKARVLAESYGIEDIEYLCSDGIKDLPYEPDSIVIAGMGGREIVSILQQRAVKSRLILMPHQDTWILRTYLLQKGVGIEKDFVVRDGKRYYDLIVVASGKKYQENEIFLGKNLPETTAFFERLSLRRSILEGVADKAKNSGNIQKIVFAELEEVNRWLK